MEPSKAGLVQEPIHASSPAQSQHSPQLSSSSPHISSQGLVLPPSRKKHALDTSEVAMSALTSKFTLDSRKKSRKHSPEPFSKPPIIQQQQQSQFHAPPSPEPPQLDLIVEKRPVVDDQPQQQQHAAEIHAEIQESIQWYFRPRVPLSILLQFSHQSDTLDKDAAFKWLSRFPVDQLLALSSILSVCSSTNPMAGSVLARNLIDISCSEADWIQHFKLQPVKGHIPSHWVQALQLYNVDQLLEVCRSHNLDTIPTRQEAVPPQMASYYFNRLKECVISPMEYKQLQNTQSINAQRELTVLKARVEKLSLQFSSAATAVAAANLACPVSSLSTPPSASSSAPSSTRTSPAYGPYAALSNPSAYALPSDSRHMISMQSIFAQPQGGVNMLSSPSQSIPTRPSSASATFLQEEVNQSLQEDLKKVRDELSKTKSKLQHAREALKDAEVRCTVASQKALLMAGFMKCQEDEINLLRKHVEQQQQQQQQQQQPVQMSPQASAPASNSAQSSVSSSPDSVSNASFSSSSSSLSQPSSSSSSKKEHFIPSKPSSPSLSGGPKYYPANPQRINSSSPPPPVTSAGPIITPLAPSPSYNPIFSASSPFQRPASLYVQSPSTRIYPLIPPPPPASIFPAVPFPDASFLEHQIQQQQQQHHQLFMLQQQQLHQPILSGSSPTIQQNSVNSLAQPQPLATLATLASIMGDNK